MRLKFEWSCPGGTITVDVDEQDAVKMLDKNQPCSAPCDLDDLPKSVADEIRQKISETMFDDFIAIDAITKKE